MSPAQLLDVQRTAGNQAAVRLLRQPAKQADRAGATLADPPASWNALNLEFWNLTTTLVKLNATAPLIGERGDIIIELERMYSELGAPGEKSDAQLQELRKRLKNYRSEREADRKLAHEAWAVLSAEYNQERARLAASQEESDQRAGEILTESYKYAQNRLNAAGRFARPEDVGPFAHDLAGERHIEKAWEQGIQDVTGPSRGGASGGSSWPWPAFKVSQKLIEGGATGLHEAAHVQDKVTQAVDSALRHQIRRAAKTALELGDDPAAVAKWARDARHQALGTVQELAQQATRYERWAGKLHVAGKLTIVIDITASFIDVFASSPKERPKKMFIHGSRIAGGLAGAGVGARAGAKLGSRLGPKGAIVGGLIGGLVGGLAGAWGVKKVATFIANDIWPPEETYWEEDSAGP